MENHTRTKEKDKIVTENDDELLSQTKGLRANSQPKFSFPASDEARQHSTIIPLGEKRGLTYSSFTPSREFHPKSTTSNAPVTLDTLSEYPVLSIKETAIREGDDDEVSRVSIVTGLTMGDARTVVAATAVRKRVTALNEAMATREIMTARNDTRATDGSWTAVNAVAATKRKLTATSIGMTAANTPTVASGETKAVTPNGMTAGVRANPSPLHRTTTAENRVAGLEADEPNLAVTKQNAIENEEADDDVGGGKEAEDEGGAQVDNGADVETNTKDAAGFLTVEKFLALDGAPGSDNGKGGNGHQSSK